MPSSALFCDCPWAPKHMSQMTPQTRKFGTGSNVQARLQTNEQTVGLTQQPEPEPGRGSATAMMNPSLSLAHPVGHSILSFRFPVTVTVKSLLPFRLSASGWKLWASSPERPGRIRDVGKKERESRHTDMSHQGGTTMSAKCRAKCRQRAERREREVRQHVSQMRIRKGGCSATV